MALLRALSIQPRTKSPNCPPISAHKPNLSSKCILFSGFSEDTFLHHLDTHHNILQLPPPSRKISDLIFLPSHAPCPTSHHFCQARALAPLPHLQAGEEPGAQLGASQQLLGQNAKQGMVLILNAKPPSRLCDGPLTKRDFVL